VQVGVVTAVCLQVSLDADADVIAVSCDGGLFIAVVIVTATSSSSSFGGIYTATSEDVALYIHKIANLHKLSFKKIQTMAWRYGVNVASKSERDARIMVAREMIRRHLPPGAVLPDAILDPSLPPANPIVTNPEELHVVGTAQCVTDVIEQMYNLNESAVLLISYKLKSCMACKAMTPKLNKVVKELHESTEGAVKLLHVDCTARTWPALEPFSVRAFPFFQTADAISGLHEGFTANLNSIGKVREAVLREVSAKVGTCELACEFPRPESMPVVLGSMDELDID